MENCVAFLGKTLHSHSVSLHPGVFTGKFNAEGNPVMVKPPIQEAVEILLVASYNRNWR